MSEPAPQQSRLRSHDVVPDGLVHHRQQVLQYGALMSLVVPAVAGLVAVVLLRGSQSTWRGVVGFLAATVAVPTMPVTGLPVVGGTIRWLLALGSSLALWLGLGYVAARRSTRKMASSWPEWRQEWLRLAWGAWIGALIGMAGAGAYLLLLA